MTNEYPDPALASPLRTTSILHASVLFWEGTLNFMNVDIDSETARNLKPFREKSHRATCRGLLLTLLLCALASTALAQMKPPATESTIWRNGIGDGFQPSVRSLSLEAGVHHGLAEFGSWNAHHMVLFSLSYGHMFGDKKADKPKKRCGNWEWRFELFGGQQYSPTDEWLVGLTPRLRYTFATGTRWMPFIDAGVGVTATGIGPPDLSNTFEFNSQAAVGSHWFVRDDLALTFEARYMHVSCAGISHPNNGVNGVIGMVGLTKFF
jgi:lipid A 3-O-deacylase